MNGFLECSDCASVISVTVDAIVGTVFIFFVAVGGSGDGARGVGSGFMGSVCV